MVAATLIKANLHNRLPLSYSIKTGMKKRMLGFGLG